MLARADRGPAPSIADKVAFLGQAGAYGLGAAPVARRETHMSWLFFVDETVFKLKKPVRFSYLDFSTLARREAACRAEYALNQQLAPQVYEGVVPLVRTSRGLALGGEGEVVDWLVRMRRLDQDLSLEARLLAGATAPAELDALAALLARFYRRAPRVRVPPGRRLADWRAAIAENARVLTDPRLGLPAGRVRAVLALQRRFLRVRGDLLVARARQGRIVDAHGDLRPEHVWMGPPIKIIDRLEFSAALRAVDPLDELAFLGVEAERLGAAGAGARIARRTMVALHEEAPPALYLFYRTHRALLRARLSIAHLLEPDPRTPEKWPRQARAYLEIAVRDARALAVLLRSPAGR
jgi:aminoglycoside phosphotransferase family enzyme